MRLRTLGRWGRATLALGLVALGCAKDPAPKAAERGEAKVVSPALPAAAGGASCADACAHLRKLTMAELETTAAQLSPEMAGKLRAQAEAAEQTDLAHCTKECDAGALAAACVIKLSSVAGLAACKPAPPRPRAGAADAEAAVKATLASCEPFHEAAAADQGCDDLATALDKVSAAMPGVPNHHDAPAVDDCIDLALDLQSGRCKEAASYQAAAQRLTRVIMSLK